MRSKNKKQINIEIGEGIRYYREKAGYSRDKFAELLGITPRFLADAETGFVGVSITNLKRICELLGISSDRLLWNKRNELGLDERVKHIESRYMYIIENIIQNQLELITMASSHDKFHKTRR